jgi:hypothetical protein
MTTLPSDRFMQISAVVLKNYDDIHLNTPMLNFRYKQWPKIP